MSARLRLVLATLMLPMRWLQGLLAVPFSIFREMGNGTHQGSGLWKPVGAVGGMGLLSAGLMRIALMMSYPSPHTGGQRSMTEKADEMAGMLVPAMVWLFTGVVIVATLTILWKALLQHKAAFGQIVGPHASGLQVLRERARLERMLKKASAPVRQRRL